MVGRGPARDHLAVRLAARGIRLTADPGDGPEADIAAVLVGPDVGPEPVAENAALGAVAWRTGAPLLTLGPGCLPGRLRLGEPRPTGDDWRLHRLLAAWGAALPDETVTAVAAALPVLADDTSGADARLLAVAPDPPAAWRRALEPEGLGALAARHGLRLARGADPAAGILLTAGGCPAAWGALALGRELVCLGASPFAGLGLTHDAPCPADLDDALASVAGGKRNRRDHTRRALAVEALFNAIPYEPAPIAAALDAAIGAIGRCPRRSVSIVITSHNYRAFIGAAVESALAQTVPAREVVVVDDGSTDGSAELIEAIPGIVAVRKAQGGQASALNAGFACTTGDLVMFLDADDRLLPEAVERIGSVDQRGVSRLFFALETIDAQGRPTGLHAPGTPGDPAASGLLAGTLMTQGIFPFLPTSGNAWPRWVLGQLMPMPESDFRLCADLFLVLGAAVLGEAVQVDGVLGQYRIHGGNGFFDPLSDGLQHTESQLRQRRRAWQHLVERPPSALPAPQAARLRLALSRLALATATEAGAALGQRLSDTGRALVRAGSVRTLLAARRHAHSGLTRLALSRTAFADARPSACADLLAAAGPTTWPRLGPGARLDLAAATRRHGLAGRGWSRPAADGLRLAAREGIFAFRLPELGCNWRLRLAFAIEDDAPLRGVEVALNGTRIEHLDLHRLGTIDLRLPVGLLRDWHALAPGPGPGASAACLALRVQAGDAGRLWISEVRVDPLPARPPPAPRLPVGWTLRVGEGDNTAAACLGAGWDWPDARGALLAGAGGHVCVSCAEREKYALALVLEAVDAGGPEPRAAQFRVVVNGVLAAAHSTRHSANANGKDSCVTLVSALPARAMASDARLKVELQPCADPDTDAWPAVRLRGLRLDRLADLVGRPLLVPNLPAPAGLLVAVPGADAEGLVADGGLARVTATRFVLRLRLEDMTGGRLLLRLGRAGAGEGSVAVRLRVGGDEVRVLLGRDAVVPLDLAEGDRSTGPDMLLEGRVDGPVGSLVLRSVELRRAPFAREPGRDLVWTDDLGPEALAACALDLDRWHAPVPDGIWLACPIARLLLPPPPPGTRGLAVTVLTLDAAGQRLRVGLAGHAKTTTHPGPETLHLPLLEEAGARPAVELAVSCDGLVAADLVGATPPGVLGGALCRVAALPAPALSVRDCGSVASSGSRP